MRKYDRDKGLIVFSIRGKLIEKNQKFILSPNLCREKKTFRIWESDLYLILKMFILAIIPTGGGKEMGGDFKCR